MKFLYKTDEPIGYYQFTLTCAVDDCKDPSGSFGQLQELSPEDCTVHDKR